MWVHHLEKNFQRYSVLMVYNLIRFFFFFTMYQSLYLDDQLTTISVLNFLVNMLNCTIFVWQNVLPGSVLVGSITYGVVSSFSKKDDQNQHAPASYSISYLIPPSKVSVPDAGSLFVSLSALLFLWSCIICYTASSGLNPYSRSS